MRSILLGYMIITSFLLQSCKEQIEFDFKRYMWGFFITLVIGAIGFIISSISKKSSMFYAFIKVTIVLIMLTSCNDTNEVVNENDAEIESKIIDSLKMAEKMVDVEYLETEKFAEINFKNQLDDYQKALFEGNVDLAYSYFYKGSVAYLKETFPDTDINDEYIKNNILRPTSSMIAEANKTKNTNFEFVIGRLICKEEYFGSLIYVVETSLDATFEGRRKSSKGLTIGISEDHGKNWTFLSRDEETTPPVLTKYFNKKIANSIMACK